jgi:hypothetical protein
VLFSWRSEGGGAGRADGSWQAGVELAGDGERGVPEALTNLRKYEAVSTRSEVCVEGGREFGGGAMKWGEVAGGGLRGGVVVELDYYAVVRVLRHVPTSTERDEVSGRSTRGRDGRRWKESSRSRTRQLQTRPPRSVTVTGSNDRERWSWKRIPFYNIF